MKNSEKIHYTPQHYYAGLPAAAKTTSQNTIVHPKTKAQFVYLDPTRYIKGNHNYVC